MIVKNIVAVCGEYTNKAGEKKKNYVTIGKFFIKEDGKQSIKLENIPLGRTGWASIYDIEKKENNSVNQEIKLESSDDDLPF